MKTEPQKCVIIVDDEKSYVELLSQLVADHLDCPVHAFSRPLDALRALPTLDVAVVVTDYFMADLNGLELIDRARALLPGVPFIMITGHDVSTIESEIRRLPELKKVLLKPEGTRQLVREILRVWPGGRPAPLLADAISI